MAKPQEKSENLQHKDEDNDASTTVANEELRQEKSSPEIAKPCPRSSLERNSEHKDDKQNNVVDSVASLASVSPLSPQTSPERTLEPQDDNQNYSARSIKSSASASPLPNSSKKPEELKKNPSSPKRKRSRDQSNESYSSNSDEESDKPGSTDDSVNYSDRTTRQEPEKKRPRDASTDQTKSSPSSPRRSNSSDSPKKVREASIKASKTKSSPGKLQTSSSAFLNSGFASLAASTTSPFGNLATTKPSIFLTGSATENKSVVNPNLSANSPALTVSGLGFGFGNTNGSGTLSGFASLGGGNIFGLKPCASFSGNSGPKLSSFAGPSNESKPLASKPARAFGAPESEEDKSEVDSNHEGDGTEDEENHQLGLEEKKKFKLTKVHIDDGEAEEATLLQLRAKLFALESKETGWKERGVGMLKINVPKCCVKYDQNGLAISGSYHASKPPAEDESPKAPRVARLIMRQENTHRVVLNTIILPQMQIEEKAGTSSAQLVFTAFEGEKELKPIKMLLKMSEINAKLFKSEMESIKREL